MRFKVQLATAVAAFVGAAALASVPTTASARHTDFCTCVAETGGNFDYCSWIYMQTLCAKAASPTTVVWDRR